MQNLVWKLILLDSACLPKILDFVSIFKQTGKYENMVFSYCLHCSCKKIKAGNAANNLPRLSKTKKIAGTVRDEKDFGMEAAFSKLKCYLINHIG